MLVGWVECRETHHFAPSHGGFRFAQPTLHFTTFHAASAGRTRRVISPPRSRSTTAMSYWLCRSSQNCALLPK